MLRTPLRQSALVAAGLLAAAVVPALTAAPAQAWAPAASAAIHPGTQMYTAGAQCTGNFVFADSAGHVYVGYAAHCAGLGSETDTNGCTTSSVKLGTNVTFNKGGSVLTDGTVVGRGKLAYSSWITMHRRGTRDADACAYNDLALVRVNPADKGKVNPTVPVLGGPTGIDTNGVAAGDRIYSYGNSSLRAGLEVLSPKVGASLGDGVSGTPWSHTIYTVTPGVPGDSGSGFMSSGGKAVGVLSTLDLLPLPASNSAGDLSRELSYAKSYSGIKGLHLVKGTKPFVLPAVL